MAFVFIGCGGSGSGTQETSKTTNSDNNTTTTTTTDTTTATHTVKIDGFVYERKSSQSYTLDINDSVAKIPSSSITFGNASSTCNDDGSFEVKSNSVDYTPLHVEKSSYIPINYTIWEDKNQTIPIGLYKTVDVVKKSGFVKGMVFLDLGNTYPFTFWEKIIDEPKQRLNAQVVSYVYNGFNYGCDKNNHSVSIASAHPDYPQWRMPTKEELEPLVAKVHAAGMKFNLWLDLVSVKECGNGVMFSWDQGDTAFWDSWFDQYENFMKKVALIAKELNIEYLTLGHNFSYASSQSAAKWQQVINAIKALHPSVQLTYFGGVNFAETPVYFESDSYNEGNNPNEFASLFDAIGFTFTAIANTKNPSRDTIKTNIRAIETKASAFSVPVWIAPATPSTTVGASDATFIEPELLTSTVGLNYTTDFYQQADVYEALFEVVNETNGGVGHIMGVFPWGYHLRDNYKDTGAESNSTPNTNNLIVEKTANIRGKPAESVVQWWYGKL